MSRIQCFGKSLEDSYSFVATEDEVQKKKPLWLRILTVTAIVLLSILFLFFMVIWVALPIAFMESISFERFCMFIPIDQPSNPVFDDPSRYNIEGVFNFYFSTLDLDNLTVVKIGAWLIMPKDEIAQNYSHNEESALILISNTRKPIVIYLHGVMSNRARPVQTYSVLRPKFLVIAPDHRGYADSGHNVEQSEMGIVNDYVQLFKWIRSITNNQIYFWGHSLGSALSAHTIKILKESHNIVPTGLTLESPFSTMREEVENIVIAKIFSWLVYFNATVLHPLEVNNFLFKSTTNILSVDCPIMIIIAEDDDVVPYFLAKKLADVASTQRDPTQGKVIYHQFPPVGYKHNDISKDPALCNYINDFINVCNVANKARG